MTQRPISETAGMRGQPPAVTVAQLREREPHRMVPSVQHNRERELVELVDEQGRAVGECTVEEAHRTPGQLHRAFSILLVDPIGRLLLQQRAATKTRFPLCWANACCGHPAPGELVSQAATRRLAEELGLRAAGLTEIGVYIYRAVDPQTGRVEYEYDHVLLGLVASEPALRPNPDEVAAIRWVTPDELTRDLEARADAHAPWLEGVARTLADWHRRYSLGSPKGRCCPHSSDTGDDPLPPLRDQLNDPR